MLDKTKLITNLTCVHSDYNTNIHTVFQIISLASDHLQIVKQERSVYREICKSARQNLKDMFTMDGTCQPPGPGSIIPALHNNMKMHYSFDMAQQVMCKYNQ